MRWVESEPMHTRNVLRKWLTSQKLNTMVKGSQFLKTNAYALNGYPPSLMLQNMYETYATFSCEFVHSYIMNELVKFNITHSPKPGPKILTRVLQYSTQMHVHSSNRHEHVPFSALIRSADGH